MMEFYKFYLTQSHFGADSKGVGVEKTTEWLHSDTIFSALVNSYARLYPKETTEKLLCSGKPKFQVSSGFLGKGEDLFFPKPNLFFPGQEEGNDEFLKNQKELKKSTFLSFKTLEKWFKNDSSEDFYKLVKNDGEAYKNLFKTRVKGVNSVSRAENGAVPFYRGETFYDEGVFLWFLVKFEDGGKAEFEKAVDALCEVGGFGGELNLGYGRVKKGEEKKEKLPFNDVTEGFSEGKKNLLLSLASPSRIDSENLEGESYDLVLRKGYIAHSSQRKNPVWCFREGSVFTKFPLSGEIFEVGKKGDYSVYRDLRAFWINF